MILELDCGNSFIKWRVIHTADATIVGGGIVDSDQALIAQVTTLSARLTACRIVSVRSEEETTSLCALIDQAFGVVARVARPARQWLGCVMATKITSAWGWTVGWPPWGLFIWPRARAW